MDYLKVYNKLIRKRQTAVIRCPEYFEDHHIKPKSLFPNLDKVRSNHVRLTAREHYIAHLLLAKIYPTWQMRQAAFMMGQGWKSCSERFKMNGRLYEKVMEKAREDISLPVLQFSLNGDFICKHKSCLAASMYIRGDKMLLSDIAKCCKFKKLYVKGFIWIYDDCDSISSLCKKLSNEKVKHPWGRMHGKMDGKNTSKRKSWIKSPGGSS